MDIVTSTLDEAAQSAGLYPQPTWFTANQQTKSRGRRGRAWVSPLGNFYGTLSVIEPDPARAALRSFIASLALADAIGAVTPSGTKLDLKWPNDVLLNGGKVAGILLETLTGPNGMWGVAVGIGVNLVAAPKPADVEKGAVRPVSVQGETGGAPSPDAFLRHLAHAFDKWESQFQQLGFTPIRNAWLARASHLGNQITVRLPNHTLSGLFKDMNAEGHLILAMEDGDKNITAGDVFFGG